MLPTYGPRHYRVRRRPHARPANRLVTAYPRSRRLVRVGDLARSRWTRLRSVMRHGFMNPRMPTARYGSMASRVARARTQVLRRRVMRRRVLPRRRMVARRALQRTMKRVMSKRFGSAGPYLAKGWFK